MILHYSLFNLFYFLSCYSADLMGITSPYFDLLQRHTEQMSSFAVLQYIERGSWCSLHAIVGAIDCIDYSASSGLPIDERWILCLLFMTVWGEYSLLTLDSLSFTLVLLSLGSWETFLDGDRNDLFFGTFPTHAEHLCEFLLDLTQWKHILCPQAALSKLYDCLWQVWQFLLYFIGDSSRLGCYWDFY